MGVGCWVIQTAARNENTTAQQQQTEKKNMWGK